jgi:hypothetical protein
MAKARGKTMAEAKGKKSGETNAGPGEKASTGGTPKAATARLGIRLTPVGNSDQPVFANYTALNVAPGVVFIDFGFFEPGVLAALPRVARAGGKLPETLNGRLAVRVALAYDSVQNLKRQLDQLVAPRAARTGGSEQKEQKEE